MTTVTRRTVMTYTALGAAALPLLAARAQAAEQTVSIEGFAFLPADLTIAAGDTVTFTNADGAPHTSTSDSGAWDTGTLNEGAAAQVTFSAPGTYPYHCAIHTHMKAVITVT